ncbi:hypothetical protein [Hyalangium sp.]|uniref:hypothetical protein n=1 Tax=Hyalangium sp. TaxID=2028555 RepID=UPI002D2F4700|nr:hypothetical protein [Hyalangium sp.]HYI00863.1 hypothetical protein [Hyalangium sp.]
MADEEDQIEPVPEIGTQAARAADFLRRFGAEVRADGQGLLSSWWDAIQFALHAASDDGGDGWTPLGPRNVAGAVRCLAQDPTNPDVIYAGAAMGGLWRTEDQGATWAPVADRTFSSTPVSAIAIAPTDNQVIYVGTGDVNTGGVPGIGLFKSVDRGATFVSIATGNQWTMPPPAAPHAFRYTRIVVDPREKHRAWVASSNGLWRLEGPLTSFHEEALTYNAPAAFHSKKVSDVALIDSAPTNEVWLLAAVYGERVLRGVFSRASGTTTWTVSNGVPPSIPGRSETYALDRIRLSFAPSDRNVAYALVGEAVTGDEKGKLYPLPLLRSANGGVDFAFVRNSRGQAERIEQPSTTKNGQSWYSMELAVHPRLPDTVIAGHVDLHRTHDGGATWTQLIHWPNYMIHHLRAQHGDTHAIIFDNREQGDVNAQRIWVGNDGGVSFTEDRGTVWRKRSYGLLGAQFVDITTHPKYPSIYGGGMQDNGTFVSYGGPTWFRMGGGDGGCFVTHPTDPRKFFTSTQEGFNRATVGADRVLTPLREVPPTSPNADDNVMRVLQEDVSAGFGGHTALFRGLLFGDDTTPERLLAGRAGAAFLSTNGGAGWTKLTTGTYTAFASGTGTPETTALTFGSPGDPSIFLGTETGDIFASPDGGGTWVHTTPFNSPGAPPAVPPTIARIDSFALLPGQPKVVAVSAQSAGAQQVMLSHDGGSTWINISGVGQLPPGPVFALAFHPSNERILHAGTLVGCFVTRALPQFSAAVATPPVPANPNWRAMNGTMGAVMINDLEVVAATQTLRAATFSRGCWETNIRDVDGAGNAGAVHTPEPFQVKPILLNIRNHALDDGRRYEAANTLTTDPRLADPARIAHLDGTRSIDIKVNAPELVDRRKRFLLSERYGHAPDGSELDEEFMHELPLSGDKNRVYVQVHNRGHAPSLGAKVHLYWANAGGGAGTVPAITAAINFPNPPLPASDWKLAGILSVGPVLPGHPKVAAFDWVMPLKVKENVALLAVCFDPGAGADPLAALPAGPALELVQAERRVGLLVTRVRRESAYIRDGVDDLGRRGSVAWGARSPDILVMRKAAGDAFTPAQLEDQAGPLSNLNDPRRGDRVKEGNDNAIFVRVHNPHDADIKVEVRLTWSFQESVSSGPWVEVATPANPAVLARIPAEQWRLARFDLTAPDPSTRPAHGQAILLAASVRVLDPDDNTEIDPAPNISLFADADAFWNLFNRGSGGSRAALRALRYEETV